MKPRRILVHGHRGAAAIYPENTLPGFEYAIRAGADALELDVAVTRDDVLVVAHDPHLNSVNALIRGLMLDEVRTRAPIPTLDQVLELGAGNDIRFDIELKSFPDHSEYTPVPEQFAAMTLEAIQSHKLESRAVVRSFDFRTLHAMKKLSPRISLAALYEGPPRHLVEIAREAEAAIVSPHFSLVTRGQVDAAHGSGLEVIPWTVNESADWHKLIGDDVDGIITDDPAGLLEHLEKRGLR